MIDDEWLKDAPVSVDEFLASRVFPGRVLFCKVWGSHSHNTDLPGSDWDYLTVYQAPTEQVLGLFPPRDTVDGKTPDFEAHEIGKFCQLLLKGNPSIMECLWTERLMATTPDWLTLKAERNRFLSRKAALAYLGYAKDQLGRYDRGARLHTKGGEKNEKWLYHLVRVAQDGLRVVRGDGPVVWKEALAKDFLMSIRTGELREDLVVSEARNLIAELKSKVVGCSLPPEGDAAWLNEWLIDLRRRG